MLKPHFLYQSCVQIKNLYPLHFLNRLNNVKLFVISVKENKKDEIEEKM